MTDIDRLLKTSPNHRTRELLDAGLEDAPPRGSLARVATGLGVVVGGSTWSAVAAGAGSAAGAAGAVSSGTLTLLGAGKLLAVGALAGTLVSGASVAIQHARAPVAPAASAHVVAPPALDAPRIVETSALAEPAAPGVEIPKPDAPTTATNDASLAAPRTAASDSGALAAEVARIDAARSALANGDAERALAELAAYQRERRLGVLDREATLLAIRAHSERGETGRARELARRYLGAHPDDAHAPRLRELLDEK